MTREGGYALSWALSRCARGPAANAREDDPARWNRGPAAAVLVEHFNGADLPALLSAWTAHVATGGYLVLHGWAFVAAGHPPVAMWKGPDGRMWFPVVHGHRTTIYQCVGCATDA